MRLQLLFGFLGSGKTTLAALILKEWGGKSKLALIVNEFGEVGVDGAILRGSAIDMIELSSGCLCCTLKGSLLNAVEELAAKGADHIVIEATGVASPEELLENFAGEALLQTASIGPIVTVVDAPKFLKIRDMLGEFYLSQIEFADLIILNKVDLASAEVMATVSNEIRIANPDALIRIAEQCDIELSEIMAGPVSTVAAEFLGLPQASGENQNPQHDPLPAHHHGIGHAHDASSDHHLHDHDHDHDHNHDHRHAPAESFVLDIAGTISKADFQHVMAAMPERLWRAKGFVRLQGRDHLVQYAMGDLQITACEERERHYMVFIGQDLDPAAIANAINSLTRQEVSN